MRQPVPFGKYLLLDRISVGGMAEVFKAKSYGVEGFEKIIAIKRILPTMGEDRDFIKMFIDEAKIAGQLAHANICQIFELGRIDGSHFIAMEYIWGKDLLQIQNRLRKLKQPMPIAMGCFTIAKVLEGLDYAHRKRDPMGRPLEIVHRDCSPQNVLVSYEGEVKVIDFGIAKATSRNSRTMAGVLKGKFGYMSPEQVRGLPLDRRSDIFALGTMLYECLTSERLFQGETDFSTLEKVRNVDIQPPRQINPNIPADVERIILKALARDVDERYQWCSEMLADLQQFLMNQEVVSTAKTMSGWVKEMFAPEIDRERALLEQYKRVGRDGLIAGVPSAEAKLDVVEHLGEAGEAADPTMLGGPNFDDVEGQPSEAGPALGSPAAMGSAMNGPRGAAPATPAAGAPANGSLKGPEDRDDFGEEVPTEIFGEINHGANPNAASASGTNTPAAGSPPPGAGPSAGKGPPTARPPSPPRGMTQRPTAPPPESAPPLAAAAFGAQTPAVGGAVPPPRGPSGAATLPPPMMAGASPGLPTPPPMPPPGMPGASAAPLPGMPPSPSALGSHPGRPTPPSQPTQPPSPQHNAVAQGTPSPAFDHAAAAALLPPGQVLAFDPQTGQPLNPPAGGDAGRTLMGVNAPPGVPQYGPGGRPLPSAQMAAQQPPPSGQQPAYMTGPQNVYPGAGNPTPPPTMSQQQPAMSPYGMPMGDSSGGMAGGPQAFGQNGGPSFTPSGMQQAPNGYGDYPQAGAMHGYAQQPGMQGNPSGLDPYGGAPQAFPAQEPARGRSSLGRDIAIGIGIAAVALVVIILVKVLVLDKGSSTPAPTTSTIATIHVTLPAGITADLLIDGTKTATVTNGLEVPVGAGTGKKVKLIATNGASCEQKLDLVGGATSKVDCTLTGGTGSGSAATAGSGAASGAGSADGSGSATAGSAAGSASAASGSAAGSATPAVAAAGSAAGSAAVVVTPPTTPVTPPPTKPITPPTTPAIAVTPPPPTKPVTPTKPVAITPTKPTTRPTTPDRMPTEDTHKPKEPQSSGAAKGYVMVYSRPSAHVLVDGADTGKMTPLMGGNRLELSPGKHKITLVNGDDKVTLTENVEAGKTDTISKNLE